MVNIYGKLRQSVLRTQEHSYTHYNRPILNTTWMGNTHEETNVLPGSRQNGEGCWQANYLNERCLRQYYSYGQRVVDMSWPL